MPELDLRDVRWSEVNGAIDRLAITFERFAVVLRGDVNGRLTADEARCIRRIWNRQQRRWVRSNLCRGWSRRRAMRWRLGQR